MRQYFLAIVLEQNLIEGEILPAYILCQSKGKHPGRSGLRVMNMTNEKRIPLSPLCVKNPYVHDYLVDFMSNFRTRDHGHGDSRYSHEETKKYCPHGALFWFEVSGTMKPTGRCIYVKRVPDKSIGTKIDQGFARLKEAMNREIQFNELFMDEDGIDMINVKKELSQLTHQNVYNYKAWSDYKKRKKAYKEAVEKYGEENVKRSDFMGLPVWEQTTGRSRDDLMRYKRAKNRSDAVAQRMLETWQQAEDKVGGRDDDGSNPSC